MRNQATYQVGGAAKPLPQKPCGSCNMLQNAFAKTCTSCGAGLNSQPVSAAAGSEVVSAAVASN